MNDIPLSGIRVIDISSSYAGPFASQLLGDMGADVIKIEKRLTGDEARIWGLPYVNGESSWFMSVNRNKRSITLDINKDEGINILFKLLKNTDVFIENMRPEAISRKRFNYDEVIKINSKIIYCSITGFGMDGPYKNFPAYDLIAEGYSGIMALSTEEGKRPLKVGTAASDIIAGMIAGFAIVSALFKRGKTGEGEFIDVSLFESMISFMSPRIVSWITGGEPQRCMGGAESPIAIYRSFATKDGFINIAIPSDNLWNKFIRIIDATDELGGSEFATNELRKKNQKKLHSILEGIFLKRTCQDWLSILKKNDIPCGPIYYPEELLEDAQVKARKVFIEMHHPKAGKIKLVNPPWRFKSYEKIKMEHKPPPYLGQHTEEILKEIGFNETDIKRFRENKII